MIDSSNKHVTGQCHCGAVRFEADLANGFTTAMRCTCSLCRMRGAVVVLAQREDFHLLSDQKHFAEYRFNTGAAQHFFCKTCGIYTHHLRRFDQNQYAINAACLDGVSPFDFTDLPVVDGVNHPLDGDGVLRVAGRLRYSAA